MYSDGDRKTISELRRAAAATRHRILEEASQLERVRKVTARVRHSTEELLRVFARELEETETNNNSNSNNNNNSNNSNNVEDPRECLLAALASPAETLELSCVPLLPVTIALANGQLSHVKHLQAVGNKFVEDEAIVFLAHVLRFLPTISPIQSLDISETRVTEKGLSFILEMMSERDTPFTLTAINLTPAEIPVAEVYKTAFQEALRKAELKKNCIVKL